MGEPDPQPLPVAIRSAIALTGALIVASQAVKNGEPSPWLIVAGLLMMLVLKPEDLDKINPWGRR